MPDNSSVFFSLVLAIFGMDNLRVRPSCLRLAFYLHLNLHLIVNILFQVYCRSDNNRTSSNFTVDVLKAEKEIPVSHLMSGTMYAFQVATVNQYGVGPKTKELRVRTVFVSTTPGKRVYIYIYIGHHRNYTCQLRSRKILSEHRNYMAMWFCFFWKGRFQR